MVIVIQRSINFSCLEGVARQRLEEVDRSGSSQLSLSWQHSPSSHHRDTIQWSLWCKNIFNKITFLFIFKSHNVALSCATYCVIWNHLSDYILFLPISLFSLARTQPHPKTSLLLLLNSHKTNDRDRVELSEHIFCKWISQTVIDGWDADCTQCHRPFCQTWDAVYSNESSMD